MERDLATLKDKLWDAFENAVKMSAAYSTSTIGPEHLKAAGEIAKAIVAAESEERAREEAANGGRFPLKKPGTS